MGQARFAIVTQSLRGAVLALALLLSSAVVAQVSRPTVLQGCQIQLADWTLEIPDNGTVTPRAGDLVIAFVGYGGAASNSNDIVGIDTPAWAARAWTLITDTPRVGSGNVRVAAYWTIANGSPTADNTVLTFSSQGFQHNSGGCLVSYDAGTFDAANPIAQVDFASAATLAGGTALTGTFDRTPASGSQLLLFGKTFGEPFWGMSDPSPGWTKLELPGPTEEGGNQISYMAGALATNGAGYGSDFGNASPAHDQNGGATVVALEIQSAGGGAPPPPTPAPSGGGGGGAILLELMLLAAATCWGRRRLGWRAS